MHQNGLTHGNIRPEYIGYDAKNNNYLLMDRITHDKPIEKLLFDNITGSKPSYMSPSLYSKLKGKNK